MSDVSKLNVHGTVYDLKDASALHNGDSLSGNLSLSAESVALIDSGSETQIESDGDVTVTSRHGSINLEAEEVLINGEPISAISSQHGTMSIPVTSWVADSDSGYYVIVDLTAFGFFDSHIAPDGSYIVCPKGGFVSVLESDMSYTQIAAKYCFNADLTYQNGSYGVILNCDRLPDEAIYFNFIYLSARENEGRTITFINYKKKPSSASQIHYHKFTGDAVSQYVVPLGGKKYKQIVIRLFIETTGVSVSGSICIDHMENQTANTYVIKSDQTISAQYTTWYLFELNDLYGLLTSNVTAGVGSRTNAGGEQSTGLDGVLLPAIDYLRIYDRTGQNVFTNNSEIWVYGVEA